MENYQNEIENLKKSVATFKNVQSAMRQANVICRNKKYTDEQKKAKLMELGYGEMTAEKILEPDWCGRIGFKAYELTSINEKIKRQEARIQELADKDGKEDFERRIDEQDLTIEVSYTDNRIRLVYDDKPDKELIAKLKHHGFKWSPSNSAWQRMITRDSFWAVERVTGIDLNKKEAA